MAASKVSTTLRLTERQDQAITQEARRLDISFGDLVRRILDDWMQRQPPKPIAGRIV